MDPINVNTGQVGSATPAIGNEAPNAPDAPQDSSLVPDPIHDLFLGDAMERIAAMLIKSFREDRRVSKNQERLQEQIIMKEAKARVKEMREQAKEIGNSAWRSGVGQIASGAFTIGSAFASSKPETKAAESDAGSLAGEASSRTDKTHSSINWATSLQGAAVVSKGMGEWSSGACDEAAKDHEASATEHEAAKEAATRRADQVRDETKDIEAMLDRVVEFLESVSDAENKATQAAIMRA